MPSQADGDKSLKGDKLLYSMLEQNQKMFEEKKPIESGESNKNPGDLMFQTEVDVEMPSRQKNAQ
jgi:hypothetical protein